MFANKNTYIATIALKDAKTSMTEFFTEMRNSFYPDQDISFMEYFMSICDKEEEFIVHHDKLREYGIMSSMQSCNIKNRLITLKLVEGQDYQLIKVYELRNQGGSSEKHIYHLTPRAFKKCLMRAGKHKAQEIDVIRYADYYLLLEVISKYYFDYEKEYMRVQEARKLAMKDDKIEQLMAKLEVIESKSDVIIQQNDGLRHEIGIVQEQNEKIIKEVTSLSELVADLCFTPKIVENLIKLYSGGDIVFNQEQKPWHGIDECKMFFVIVWYNEDCTRATYRVACRNFSETPKRIKQIINEMNNENGNFYTATAIGLCDKDVNEEIKLIEKVFGSANDTSNQADKITCKRYDINTANYDEFEDEYIIIIKKLRKEFLLRHEKSISSILSNDDWSKEALMKAKLASQNYRRFNHDANNWCQAFIDSYINETENGDTNIPDSIVKMPKEYIIKGVDSRFGSPYKLNALWHAKTQLKMCVRAYAIHMNEFAKNLRD